MPISTQGYDLADKLFSYENDIITFTDKRMPNISKRSPVCSPSYCKFVTLNQEK